MQMHVPNSVTSASPPSLISPTPVTNVHRQRHLHSNWSLLVLPIILPLSCFSTLTFTSIGKWSPSKHILSFLSRTVGQKGDFPASYTLRLLAKIPFLPICSHQSCGWLVTVLLQVCRHKANSLKLAWQINTEDARKNRLARSHCINQVTLFSGEW